MVTVAGLGTSRVALTGLLKDRDKLNQLSRRGRKGVEEKFNIHLQAKDIVNLYENIKNRSKTDTHAA